MAEDPNKQAAQEYLAAQLTEDGLTHNEKLARDAAITLAPAVWKSLVAKVFAMCQEWNSVTNEQTLTCKETALGDLRIRCASSAAPVGFSLRVQAPHRPG